MAVLSNAVCRRLVEVRRAPERACRRIVEVWRVRFDYSKVCKMFLEFVKPVLTTTKCVLGLQRFEEYVLTTVQRVEDSRSSDVPF